MPGSQLELNLSDIKVDGTNGYVHTVQYSTLTAILNARSERIDSKLPSEHELAVLRGLFDGIPVQASQCCMAATYLAQAMLPQLVYAAPESTRGLRITIVSRGLPLGAGLGSSAAYSVALAAALRRLKQRVRSAN
jgi:mevalonate kinase